MVALTTNVNAYQPIPTLYKGHNFRSRLEARWALFFDEIGEPFDYEPEGFQLPDGWYLPDFKLPRMSAWCEVKPRKPAFASAPVRLCEQLGTATGERVLILCGSPRVCDLADPDYSAVLVAPHWDEYHAPALCPKCGAFGFEFEGRGARVCGERCFPGNDAMHSGWHPRLREAADRAQTWRPAEVRP